MKTDLRCSALPNRPHMPRALMWPSILSRRRPDWQFLRLADWPSFHRSRTDDRTCREIASIARNSCGLEASRRSRPHGVCPAQRAFSPISADESACTPGSVPGCLAAIPMGDHPSGPAVADRLVRSTRRLGRAALQRLRRSCHRSGTTLSTLLRVGFTEPSRSPGTLVVSYTTVSPLPVDRSRPAVCSLWHCPAGHPGLPLATTLPYGARTFLDHVSVIAIAQPTRPS